MDEAHDQHRGQATELRNRLKIKISQFDRQEDRYLDLVGDPDWPKEKISQRLRQIRDERRGSADSWSTQKDPKSMPHAKASRSC